MMSIPQTIFASVLLALSLAAIVECAPNDVNKTEITPVNETTRFQSLYPDIELECFEKVKLVKGNLLFTVGSRIRGDKLIGEAMDKETFVSAKNVQVRLTYPGKGAGCFITSIEILTDQTGSMGNAYLINGGEEKKFANFLLEGNSTAYYSYATSIYGYC